MHDGLLLKLLSDNLKYPGNKTYFDHRGQLESSITASGLTVLPPRNISLVYFEPEYSIHRYKTSVDPSA